MEPTTLKMIAERMKIHSSISSSPQITGVAVDSRLVKPGDLFFALPGEKVDGHKFLEEAFSKGARGAVVHSKYIGNHLNFPLIYCNDVLNALQMLAKDYLMQSAVRVVAVTGSVGKTTTKEFIASLLRTKYRVSASPGNSNSQIGLPLTILNEADLSGDILVLEMGMTSLGNIRQLISIAPPEVAVITAVALVHACNFQSIEGIAQAKAEIFECPSTKIGIYHKESNISEILSQTGECPKISFSMESHEADYFLKSNSNQMRIFEQSQDSWDLPLLHLLGSHNQQNYLAAIAVASYFGLTKEDIELAQQTLQLPERRLQIIEKFGAIFVNDSYNACELSVKAALMSMPKANPGRSLKAVLGEMLELGDFSESCHLSVAKFALDYVDEMYCYGKGCLPIFEYWKKAGKYVVWAENREGILNPLRNNLAEGDVILLKGSSSKAVWKVLDDLFCC